jgi:predicted GNAT superfamily acetyltransferase
VTPNFYSSRTAYPRLAHISQHIVGLRTSGTGESRRPDADVAHRMSAAQRDTQIGIFAQHPHRHAVARPGAICQMRHARCP